MLSTNRSQRRVLNHNLLEVRQALQRFQIFLFDRATLEFQHFELSKTAQSFQPGTSDFCIGEVKRFKIDQAGEMRQSGVVDGGLEENEFFQA